MRRTCRKSILIFALLAVILLAGCTETEGAQMPAGEEEEKIQIGMIFDNFVMERWLRDRDVFVSTAKELGAEVNVQNANSSVEEQVELVKYFIKKKVDVIVIVPIDSEPLLASIKEAQEEGIKVISYDRLILGAEPDLYISFDNEKVGTLMGTAFSKKLEKGDKVLMICGPKTDNNAMEVQRGFENVMKEKQIQVLDIYYADGWKPEYAAAYVRQNGELVRQARGIMCGNDNLAGQAVSALAEQRLAGEIYVSGQDGDLAACQRIVEGTQYMTVYKPIEKLAARAAKAAVDMAEGNGFSYDLYVTTEGGKSFPYIKLEPVAVTEENMQQAIIDEGFHLKEEVYLNRPELLD